MLSKIAAIMLLATSASAAPTSCDTPWTWNIKDFSSVCTAATCRYSFNASAPAGPSGQPSFDASFCSGTSVQGGYKSCGVVGIDVPGDVLTQEFNHGIDIGASISVQYTFTQQVLLAPRRAWEVFRGMRLILHRDGIKYTYTGNNSVAHTGNGPTADFTLIPTEVFAVPVEA